MSLPIVSSIATYLFNYLSQKAMTIGAKIFRQKYPPEKHAKKSRKFMYDNYWSKWINDAGKSKNKVDDIGVDFVYYYNACYIEDSTLHNILTSMEFALNDNNQSKVKDYIKDIRKLIEIPE